MQQTVSLVSLLVITTKGGYWGYRQYDQYGPDRWSAFGQRNSCSGKQQSPINIAPELATLQRHAAIRLSGGYLEPFPPGSGKLVNTGNTLKFVLTNTKPALFISDFTGESTLSEIIFHWGATDLEGSEHTISNRRYPLELQLIHEQSQQEQGYVMLSAMYELDKTGSGTLELDALLTDYKSLTLPGSESTNKVKLNIRALLPDDLQRYYLYNGSLTMPPCTESAVWIVFFNTKKVSASQLQRLRLLFREPDAYDGQLEPIGSNFRPIQPLNGRTLELINPDIDSSTATATTTTGEQRQVADLHLDDRSKRQLSPGSPNDVTDKAGGTNHKSFDDLSTALAIGALIDSQTEAVKSQALSLAEKLLLALFDKPATVRPLSWKELYDRLEDNPASNKTLNGTQLGEAALTLKKSMGSLSTAIEQQQLDPLEMRVLSGYIGNASSSSGTIVTSLSSAAAGDAALTPEQLEEKRRNVDLHQIMMTNNVFGKQNAQILANFAQGLPLDLTSPEPPPFNRSGNIPEPRDDLDPESLKLWLDLEYSKEALDNLTRDIPVMKQLKIADHTWDPATMDFATQYKQIIDRMEALYMESLKNQSLLKTGFLIENGEPYIPLIDKTENKTCRSCKSTTAAPRTLTEIETYPAVPIAVVPSAPSSAQSPRLLLPTYMPQTATQAAPVLMVPEEPLVEVSEPSEEISGLVDDELMPLTRQDVKNRMPALLGLHRRTRPDYFNNKRKKSSDKIKKLLSWPHYGK